MLGLKGFSEAEALGYEILTWDDIGCKEEEEIVNEEAVFVVRNAPLLGRLTYSTGSGHC